MEILVCGQCPFLIQNLWCNGCRIAFPWYDLVGHSTLVGQHPVKSLSSVRRSLRFLNIGSLVFSDIVHDDSWLWYLVSDEARFLRNIFGGLNLGPTGVNQTQNEVFCHFLEFGSWVFLEIAYGDSLRKIFCPKLGFFVIFSSLHC